MTAPYYKLDGNRIYFVANENMVGCRNEDLPVVAYAVSPEMGRLLVDRLNATINSESVDRQNVIGTRMGVK